MIYGKFSVDYDGQCFEVYWNLEVIDSCTKLKCADLFFFTHCLIKLSYFLVVCIWPSITK